MTSTSRTKRSEARWRLRQDERDKRSAELEKKRQAGGKNFRLTPKKTYSSRRFDRGN